MDFQKEFSFWQTESIVESARVLQGSEGPGCPSKLKSFDGDEQQFGVDDG